MNTCFNRNVRARKTSLQFLTADGCSPWDTSVQAHRKGSGVEGRDFKRIPLARLATSSQSGLRPNRLLNRATVNKQDRTARTFCRAKSTELKSHQFRPFLAGTVLLETLARKGGGGRTLASAPKILLRESLMVG